MKKLFLTTVFSGAMFLSAATVNAQVYENSESETPYVEQQTEYNQIKEQDLPREVKAALEKDYKGATLAEVYAAGKDGEVTYKLVVTTTDGATKELFADAGGNWIKETEAPEN